MPTVRSIGLLAVAFVGCTRGAAPPPPPPAPPTSTPVEKAAAKSYWIPGEQMVFRASMRDIDAIHAVLAVGQPGVVDGRRVIIVRSRATTTGVIRNLYAFAEEATSVIDLGAAHPLRRSWKETLNGRVRTIDTEWVERGVRQRIARNGRSYDRRRYTPRPPLDQHAIIGFLRAWSPPRPTRTSFHAIAEMYVGRHDVTFASSETIRTAVGLNPARRYFVRIAGTSLSYTAWISDDDARRPLRIIFPHRYGNVRLELIRYSRP